MKIRSIDIEQFGKLKNFHISPSDGINIIYGKNEAGKSTLVQFIKVMLYGVEKRGKSGIRDNVRKHYMPWNESYARGNMQVERNGKVYIIERTMGKTAAKDNVSVTDAVTGEDITNDIGDIGMFLTGVNENVFCNTLCTDQITSAINHNADGDIVNRLANIQQTGDENISYNKAVEYINKSLREMNSPQRKNSVIVTLNFELLELEREIKKVRELNQGYIQDKMELDKIQHQLTSLEKEFEEKRKLTEDMQKQQLYQRYTSMLAKLDDKNKGRTGLEEKIAQIRDKLTKFDEYAEYMTNQDEITQMYLQVSTYKEFNYEALENARTEKQALENSIKKYEKIRRISFILCFLIIPVFIAVWASAKLDILKDKSKNITVLIDTLTQESKTSENVQKAKKELDGFFEKMGVENYEQYKSISKEYENQLRQKELIESELRFLQESIDVVETEISGIRKDIEEKYNFDEFIKEESEKQIDKINNAVDMRDMEDISAQIQDLREQRTQLAEQINIKYKDAEDIEMLLAEHAQKTERLEYYKKKAKVFETTLDAVNEAYGVLQNDFAPILNEKTANLLQHITQDRYNAVMVSKSLEVKLKTKNNTVVDAEYLSTGAYDLIYLALRIGIVQSIFNDEDAFYLMDNPFAAYDEERITNMVDALTKMSLGQILIFTCKEHEKELFEITKEVNIINMNMSE